MYPQECTFTEDTSQKDSTLAGKEKIMQYEKNQFNCPVEATLFLIGGNNAMVFVFFSNRASLDRSLYGSLTIVPVLMLRMYVFWLLMLLGGRVSYAVQNAYSKSNKMALEPLNYTSKESISTLPLPIVCQRFRDCKPALSGRELTKISKLPVQYVNATLMCLYDLKLVS